MVIKHTILETPPNLLNNPQNFRGSLQIFPWNHQLFLRILILRLFEDPQNFLRIVILRIFWGASEFSEDRHPQNFLRIVILRIFWRSLCRKFSEGPHPQNFLRILRIFWGSAEFFEDCHPQNFLKILRIFWGSPSSEFCEDPQNFLRIVILRIFCKSSEFSEYPQKFFWGSLSSEFSEDRHRHPQNFLRILRIFWESSSSEKKKGLLSENSEGPQKISEDRPSSENSEDRRSSENFADPRKILRMTILRKFWGSSENSEDDDPQKILRILRKFWGWPSSENSEDPRKILRMTILRKFWGWRSSELILRMTILRKFWGWVSSENSEDDDPQKIFSIGGLQKILKMRILRKFWGWRSSENSEGPQKILRMTILKKFWGFARFFWQSPENSVNDNSDNHWIYPVLVSTTILAKKILQEQSQARSTALLCTQTTRSVLLVLFKIDQNYIYFKIDQNMMIIIKCIWYSIARYIQRLSEWWTLANLILKGKTNTKHAVILYTYSTRCFTCCVCLFFRAQNYLMHVAKMIFW